MKKAFVIVTTFGFLIFMLSSIVVAEEGDPQYIGSAKCKVCHKAEKRGEQYTKWEAGPHSKAYEVLASEEALAAAKGMGIDNPQTSDECLKCHVTAFSVEADLKAESFDRTEGVGCEACHGPGSEYKSLKVMKNREAALAAGMIIPNEETCMGCHNEESPTYKEFNFEEFWKKIAHPIPEEAEEEQDK
ncbi:MAG: cytochrome c family protein [Candidatus Zixiibacteriota bacterium]|nr:MAG: cytochrome c family protein [candidate division Zixibacteria bacterium]